MVNSTSSKCGDRSSGAIYTANIKYTYTQYCLTRNAERTLTFAADNDLAAKNQAENCARIFTNHGCCVSIFAEVPRLTLIRGNNQIIINNRPVF